ncbi:MAG: hypothetical protein GEU78_05090 [Actinobacteria bacterium]|nr:hypothetical protein [Actinomycetota bacterium]
MAIDVLELESSIKAVPGILGCVIMTDSEGHPAEIQAFVRLGLDPAEAQKAIQDTVARFDLKPPLRQVFVFELDAESQFGDRDSLERAAELAEQDARSRGPSSVRVIPGKEAVARDGPGARPVVDRVSLTSSSWTAESEVALKMRESEIVGNAEGEKTPHGLTVLAQATIDAAHKLIGMQHFELEAASLVNIGGRQAVLVLVRQDQGPPNLGAALVREGPIGESAVRATLAAINRKLQAELP